MPTHEEKKSWEFRRRKLCEITQLLAEHVQESLLQPRECGESHGRATSVLSIVHELNHF